MDAVIFCLSRFRLSVVFGSILDEMLLGISSKDKKENTKKQSLFEIPTLR